MEITRADIEAELRSRFALYTVYPKQMSFHNSRAVGKIISGGNQAIDITTKLLTPRGWRVAKDIKLGDILYDGDGHSCRVIEVHNFIGKQCYKLTFNDGSWIICDENHLWSMEIGQRQRENPLRGYETFDMQTVIRRCGLGKITAHKRARIPVVKGIDFSEKDLPVDPYILGHYLGNGFLVKSSKHEYWYCMQIVCGEECVKMLKIKEPERAGCVYKHKYSNGYHLYIKGSSGWAKWLRSIGCHGAFNKFIPKEYLYASDKQRRELFMGLMDSDGSCDNNGRISYTSVSLRLAKDVLELGRRLGCQWSIKEMHGMSFGKPCKYYTVRGRCIYFNPFRLPSRANKWNTKAKVSGEKLLVSIDPVESRPTVCFAVDSPLHTYICQDYIITHNCGKTFCGTHEVAFQATGIWPAWHTGWHLPARLDPISGKMVCNIVVAATDSKTLRDSIMKKIVGTETSDYTDGLISRKFMVENSFVKSRGVSGGLLDSVQVCRQDGSICTIYFRSYEQGRENLQSLTADLVYCDEEPPQDVYSEMMARLAATGGHFMMAFTPLKGMTPIVQEYWNGNDPEKELFCMSIYEVDHIAKHPEKIAQIKSMYAGLSEAEREARMMGIPAMGSGVVYPIDDAVLMCEPFEIPAGWKRIAGLDFGRGEHPIACVWLAFDPEGCCYLYDCFKLTRVGDLEVANQILSRGKWIPVSWPHDFVRSSGVSTIGGLEKTEGWKYKEIYEKYGIIFTDTNAKTAEGSVRVEAGIVEVRQAMIEGKFRVFSHLSEWFKEKATYLYKEDGSVTKERDDLLDATRYAYIMRRYAVSKRDIDLSMEGVYNIDKAIDNTEERW